MPSLTVDIPRDRSAPANARRAVERIAPAIDTVLVPDVKLLVSEIVTNSVKYGGDGDLQVLLRSEGPQHVHVEVIDQGNGFTPVPRTRPPTEVGGWGLVLVHELADRWGVCEGSTHVWFEIGGAQPLSAPPASSARSTASSVTASAT